MGRQRIGGVESPGGLASGFHEARRYPGAPGSAQVSPAPLQPGSAHPAPC